MADTLALASSFARPVAFALCIGMLATVGCGESEAIRTYTVPKETDVEVATTSPSTPPAADTAPAASGEPTDRMITAVVPVDGQAWFFKVVGPLAVVEKHEKELNDFFATIRIAEDGKPSWKLPEGWKEGGERPMRFATLLVPSDDKPLEIAISSATWPGTRESLVANVDRWRGQLKLPPTNAEKVGEDIREAKAGDRTITIVDLRGRYAGGMMPPFAGGARSAGRVAPGREGDLPPGHPPVDPNAAPAGRTAASPPAAPTPPRFTAPKDWKELPVTPGGMKVAELAIGDGERRATVTITPFSLGAGPSIADPVQNTNMWRSAVGLPPIKKDELSQYSETIELEGKPALYVRVVPDPAEPSQSQIKEATLAAMAKTANEIWFIKMKGERELVVAQEGAFKEFLKSLRLPNSGANDGNK